MHRSTGLRARLVSALLVALGVGAVTAGLASLPETGSGVGPGATAPVALASPSGTATSTPRVSATPAPSRAATPSPVPSDRVATRVAVPALGIDMPVILPPGDASAYPLCDVAMYIQQLGQPGQGQATYLYAHAREGMFLPLLTQSETDDGAGMLGMVVQVWTSDEQLFLYEITEARRHATDLDDALRADHEQLWLQTSEGPSGTVPKLQVVAEPLSNGPAPNPADAHPVPSPTVCS